MTSSHCIVSGTLGPLLEKFKKGTLFSGPCSSFCCWERADQRFPRVQRATPLDFSRLSFTCLHLSYLRELFGSIWDFNVLFYFFPCYYKLCLIQCQKEALRFCYSLAKMVNQTFISLSSNSRVDHLKSDLRFGAYFSVLHLGHSYFSFTTHMYMFTSCIQRWGINKFRVKSIQTNSKRKIKVNAFKGVFVFFFLHRQSHAEENRHLHLRCVSIHMAQLNLKIINTLK